MYKYIRYVLVLRTRQTRPWSQRHPSFCSFSGLFFYFFHFLEPMAGDRKPRSEIRTRQSDALAVLLARLFLAGTPGPAGRLAHLVLKHRVPTGAYVCACLHRCGTAPISRCSSLHSPSEIISPMQSRAVISTPERLLLCWPIPPPRGLSLRQLRKRARSKAGPLVPSSSLSSEQNGEQDREGREKGGVPAGWSRLQSPFSPFPFPLTFIFLGPTK